MLERKLNALIGKGHEGLAADGLGLFDLRLSHALMMLPVLC